MKFGPKHHSSSNAPPIGPGVAARARLIQLKFRARAAAASACGRETDTSAALDARVLALSAALGKSRVDRAECDTSSRFSWGRNP